MTTWAKLSERAGRNDMPAILVYACAHGQLLPKEVAKGLADAWTMCEWPRQAMESKYWRIIFGMALDDHEFIKDNGEIGLHSELEPTLTLWRGAMPEYREGMSWTDDRDLAKWFATRLNFSGCLYEITIPNDAILANFNNRGEREFVVDLDLLFEDDIQEVVEQGENNEQEVR
jgi:hypothetical protein